MEPFLKKDHKDWKRKDIVREAGKLWKKLDSKKKMEYQKKYKEEMKVYKEKMKKYKK